MKIVVLGLTVTSSWGNGHATTYRALLKAPARRRHALCFVEKDVEWYRNHRDLPQPDFCKLLLYQNWKEVRRRVLREAAFADVVVVGSYFPDAIAATNELPQHGRSPVVARDREFLHPGEEILLADTVEEVISILTGLTEQQLRRIGEAARDRTLQQHTADHRANEFECIVEASSYTETAQALAPAIMPPELPHQQTTR
ncbi:MAG TPA: glycosyltransferase [Acidobacteriaceae bacterium]